MNDIDNKNTVHSRQDDAANLIAGRPTVAGNSGAGTQNKNLRQFAPEAVPLAEFIRLPSPGKRCALCGLSRTSLNEVIQRGEVSAVTVRKPGAQRGIKLIRTASLLAWLNRLEAEQSATRSQGGGNQ